MKTVLNPLISEKVREIIATQVSKLPSKINFEAVNLGIENITDAICDSLSTFSCQHFLTIRNINGKTKIEIVSKSAIKTAIQDGLDGGVISLINPTSLHGITFDVDQEGYKTFTLTAWGHEAETVIPVLKKRFPSGVTFEGN